MQILSKHPTAISSQADAFPLLCRALSVVGIHVKGKLNCMAGGKVKKRESDFLESSRLPGGEPIDGDSGK